MRRLWLFGAAVSAWMVGVAIAGPPAAKKSAPGAAETGSREAPAKAEPAPDKRVVIQPRPDKAAPKRAGIEIVPAPAVVPKPPAPGTGAPGMDGSWALGHVMPTPSHPDAQPWPKGMLIEPKDIGDANIIVPGTRRLPGHPGPQSWSEAFSRGIRLGLDSVLQPLTPPIGT